jgi:hypothetical protein
VGEIIPSAVGWYCKYGVSHRDLEEMIQERGVDLDHTTLGTIPKELIVSREAREDNVFALRTANGAIEQFGTNDAHAILKDLSFSTFLLDRRRQQQNGLSEQDSKRYTCLKDVWAVMLGLRQSLDIGNRTILAKKRVVRLPLRQHL